MSKQRIDHSWKLHEHKDVFVQHLSSGITNRKALCTEAWFKLFVAWGSNYPEKVEPRVYKGERESIELPIHAKKHCV
jgi:hypothetical protein